MKSVSLAGDDTVASGVELDLKQPLIFRVNLKKDGEHQAALEHMEQKLQTFKTSNDREVAGRSHKKIPDEINTAASSWLQKILPTDYSFKTEKLSEDTQNDARVTAFMVKAGKSGTATETAYLATFRLGLFGHRKVAAAPLAQLFRHLGQSGKVATLKDCREFLGTMDGETKQRTAFQEYASQHTFPFCTLGEGDVFYCPAGWMIVEKVGDREDFAGLRMSIYCSHDLDTLEAVQRQLIAAEQPSVQLAKVLDALAVLG